VLNNCTDNSGAVLRRFIKQWGVEHKFHVVEEKLQGHVPASNTGVFQALSIPNVTHIARLDSDDIWHPEKLQKQYDFLVANPDVDVLGTNMRLFVKTTRQQQGVTNYPLTDEAIKADLERSINPIGNSSSVFHRNVVTRCGVYDDLFPYSEDFWFWLKASRWFKMANLPEHLVDYSCWSNPAYNPNVARLAAFLTNQIRQHSPLQYSKAYE